GVAVRFENAFDVTCDLLKLVVVIEVVLAPRDRLDMGLERGGERRLVRGQRRQRTAVRRPRYAGHVAQRSVADDDEQQSNGGGAQEEAEHGGLVPRRAKATRAR